MFKKKEPPREPPKQFPPVPNWKPSIVQPIEVLIDRVRYYTNGNSDFALFNHGTFVLLPEGLDDSGADAAAKDALQGVFHAHPDMHPRNMDDGNILVTYKNSVANIALQDVTLTNWLEIDRQHQNAIATHEVLLTPLGSNVFDDFGKKALFARCFMFMDALDPKVLRIVRRGA